LIEIAALVRQYDEVRLIPHGHHVLAAANCVASQPESLCPMIEYGVTFTKARQLHLSAKPLIAVVAAAWPHCANTGRPAQLPRSRRPATTRRRRQPTRRRRVYPWLKLCSVCVVLPNHILHSLL
jgi:hypothetical protein